MKTKNRTKLILSALALILCLALQITCQNQKAAPPEPARIEPAAGPVRFGVSFDKELSREPLDGRILLMISAQDGAEPRFQISDGPDTQLIFGIDVDGLLPGQAAVIDETVLGYPLKSIAEIPPG
ncbi:MAG: hypothetical protein AMJ79_09005, partial [Phycisphaerae bacterium SM23_30]